MKTFSALLCLVLFPVTLSAAQPNNLLQAPPLITLDDVGRGQLLFRTLEHGRYLPAPLVATETKITIGGILATTTVKQYFINPTNHWLEGRYVFPLPENSAVDRIILRLGNRKIEGKIAERRAARKAYNKAKAEGRRAALVMLGCVFMLIVAAVLEAFPRQLAGFEARVLIGVFMLVAWLALFILVGRREKAGAAA